MSPGVIYRVYYYASEGSTEDKVYVRAFDRDHAEDYLYDKLNAHQVADVSAAFKAYHTNYGVVEERGEELVRCPVHNAIESEVSL